MLVFRAKKQIQSSTCSTICLLIFVVFAGSPLIILIADALKQLYIGEITISVLQGRTLDLFLKTIAFSAFVAIFGILISFLSGSFLFFHQTRLTRVLKYSILFFAILPSYIHALGWNFAISGLNYILAIYQIQPALQQGFIISWWVQMMALLPFGTGIVVIGFELLDKSLLESAKILSRDYKTLIKVIIPLILPSLAAGSAFMMLICMLDYTIPSLYQVNLYSLEIFAQYSANYNSASAFLFSIPLLIVTIPVAILFQSSLKTLPLTNWGHKTKLEFRFPFWFRTIQVIAVFILFLQILVPLISLISSVGSLTKIPAIVGNSAVEIRNTLLIAFLASLLALPFTIVSAQKICQKSLSLSSIVWWFLMIVSLTTPAPLVGIGLISVWDDNIIPLYGTIMLPVLASIIRFTPFAAVVMISRLKRIDKLYFEAAHILQNSWWQTFSKIKLPLYKNAIITSFTVMFILTTAELGATLLVTPPGVSTLSIKIYNYMHYGKSDEVAGLCLIMFIFSLVSGFIILGLKENRGKK